MVFHNIVGNTITAVIDGQYYTMNINSPGAEEVCELLNDPEGQETRLTYLFNKAEGIKQFCNGEVEVKNNSVYYKGRVIDNVLTRKILQFIDEKLPYKPLIKFLERLMKNPSRRSVEQLYPFMEHEKLQISSDGKLIAYKGVRSDYYDIHSGTVYNGAGTTPPPFDRNEVDDDPARGCSYGYHVGSYEYASTWCGTVGHVMRVLVDPESVVSVPHGYNHAKVRCTEYTVLEEVFPSDMVQVSALNEEW